MKRLFKLCAVGGMALVIAACGNNEEAGEGPGDPVSDEEEIEGEGTESEDGNEEDVSSGAEETKTFVREEEGFYNELVYHYTDDEVQKQTSTSEITYEALNVSGEEEAQELLHENAPGYEDAEGVTHDIEYTEDGISETLEVDYTVADLEEIAELEGSEFEEGAEEAQFISMERSEEQLLNDGYELVEE